MTQDVQQEYPIQDPQDLLRIARQVCQAMKGTDDGPAMGAHTIGEYPPLYAAALGIMVAKVSGHAGDEDRGEWLARFLLALAQDRVRSVFDRTGEPHWPEWMEDED